MSEIIRKVDLENLGSPDPVLGGLTEIRFTNTFGETEVWMVPTWLWGEGSESLLSVIKKGGVKLAFLDSGVDSRIGLLMKQLETAREHIGVHHDELTMLYRREYGTPYNCHQFNMPPKASNGASQTSA